MNGRWRAWFKPVLVGVALAGIIVAGMLTGTDVAHREGSGLRLKPEMGIDVAEPLAGPATTDNLADIVRTIIAAQDEALVTDATVANREGRLLTVLIPYDRTRFFIHKGEPRGFEYELVRQFERSYNERAGSSGEQLQAIFVPVPFNQLVDLLASGTGDIAAGGLTITDERARKVGFSKPYLTDVREIVVARKGEDVGDDPAWLSGRQIVTVRGSSYVTHLEQLNETLLARGLAPVDVVEAPSAIMSEDLLELVNAGTLEATIVDEHIARLWSGVLDDIQLTDLAIAGGNNIAWALGASLSERMVDEINRFLGDAAEGSLLGNVLFRRYFADTRWIENPLGPEAITEVSRYRPLFSKYAESSGLDWRLVAAVAFQESGFDPSAVSAAGARGLMQVLPATARELGIENLDSPDSQIAAGVRYLARLVEQYESEGIAYRHAVNLALAAYNAGPGRLSELRQATSSELGLNPDEWFFNVERAAARDVGLETVRYVANVNKYRIAYELGEPLLQARADEKVLVE
ncbi:MAG: transglycosylase SLT domain-containing protein [Geminicoccaceae bacterium]